MSRTALRPPKAAHASAGHILSLSRLAAPLVGLIAAAISVVGIGSPSYWGDEAASVLTGERSLPGLFSVLGQIDAVHGSYYLFLHFWMQIFGTSELAVRLPSTIAIGLAASGVVVLGSQLLRLRVGVVAGLIFAILPIVTRMGVEARSYAMAMAAAVWLTVALLALVRRREARGGAWVLYGLGLAASVYLFLYLGLMVIVHLAVMFAVRAERRQWRQFIRALLVALVLAAPVLTLGFLEREQISFLARRNYATVGAVLWDQWFAGPVFAVLAWALIIVAAAALMWRRHERRAAEDRAASIILLSWLIVPTVLLLAVNAWIAPVYNQRYLSFCAPAIALLMAMGIEALATLGRSQHIRLAVTGLAVVALVATATPGYLAQRTAFAKDGGSDLRQTAEAIAAHASPGDAVIFDQLTKPSQSPRLAIDLYPQLFVGVDDIGLVTPLAQRSELWDEVAPVSQLTDELLAHRVVWVVQLGQDTQDVSALTQRGYTVQQTLPIHRMVVYKLSKEA